MKTKKNNLPTIILLYYVIFKKQITQYHYKIHYTNTIHKHHPQNTFTNRSRHTKCQTNSDSFGVFPTRNGVLKSLPNFFLRGLGKTLIRVRIFDSFFGETVVVRRLQCNRPQTVCPKVEGVSPNSDWFAQNNFTKQFTHRIEQGEFSMTSVWLRIIQYTQDTQYLYKYLYKQ